MADVGTLTLSEFLLARIAEDVDDLENSRIGDSPEWWMPNAWSRERALAECDAKRRIVAEHAPTERDPAEKEMAPGYCRMCVGEDGWPLKEGQVGVGVKAPCRTLRFLAAPHADHPDYREEWRA